MKGLRALLLGALAASAACQSTATARPAVLVTADAQTMAQLKATLARALGRTDIDLGASNPLQSPTITVLPPRPSPYEDRSRALPAVFRLELVGERCFVTAEATGERHVLEAVRCRPL
jgi:hypothetical protein